MVSVCAVAVVHQTGRVFTRCIEYRFGINVRIHKIRAGSDLWHDVHMIHRNIGTFTANSSMWGSLALAPTNLSLVPKIYGRRKVHEFAVLLHMATNIACIGNKRPMYERMVVAIQVLWYVNSGFEPVCCE